MKMSGKIHCAVLSVGLLAICAGLSEFLWRPLLHPLIFNDAGEYHTGGFMRLLSCAVSFLEDHMSYGELWGTILAVLAMPRSCALLPEPYRFWRYTLTLTGAGLIFTGISIVSSIEFFYISPGTTIRPMMWALTQFVLLIAGILTALCFGPGGVKSNAPCWLRWLGVVLCLTPCPAGSLMLNWAITRNGLIMGE